MSANRALQVSTTPMPSTARVPEVYQIDFTAVASGKRIASTKRRVRWRFGFANPEALAAGETGTACRGEEHDVTLVWSITSGKRLILADGQEVHYSSSRSGVFDHTWTMRGNHVLKVVAHASPPLSPTPGFRQYDFFVDGQTFFSFPKVYRLGLAPNDPRGARPPSSPVRLADRGQSYDTSTRSKRSASGIVSIEAPHNMDEEEAYLQEAIKNSMQENAAKAASQPEAALRISASQISASQISAGGRALLLDFEEESVQAGPPVGMQSTPALPEHPYGFAAPPPSQSMPALPPSTTTNGYGGEADFFGASAPAQAAPYGAPTVAMVPYGAPGGAQQPYAGAPPAQQQYGAPPAQPYGAPPAQGGPPQQYDGGNAQPYGAPPAAAGSQQQFGAPPAAPPAQQQPWGAPQNYNQSAAAPYDAQPGAPPAAVDTAPNAINQLAQASPSTLGFGSPQPEYSAFQSPPAAPPANIDFAAQYGGDQGFAAAPPQSATDPGFASPPQQQQQPFQEEQGYAPPAAPEGPVLTMNSLAGDAGIYGNASANGTTSGSLADQAYAKFASMDQFDLMSKKDNTRENPFEAPSVVGGNQSLADMQKTHKPAANKPVMNAMQPPQPQGALVVSNAQAGNWGGYGAPAMNQQQPGGFGGQQAPMQQQAQYGQPPQQQFGQQPQYGQPNQFAQPQQGQQPFGQQPPPQQQQNGQQQQPQYGQQQQFGQQPQYGAPQQQQGFY